MELRFYKEWILPRMESNQITEIELQKKYELQPKFISNGKTILPINYVADFYIVLDGKEIVIDTKGFATADSNIKKKMFLYKYPELEYKWITYSKIDSKDGSGWCNYDDVKKGRNERRKNKSK